MKNFQFVRIMCDVLWEIKENYPEIELSKYLHYIDTFERLGYEGEGIEITLVDNNKYNIIPSRTQKCGQ